jgi:hypothetical protein
MAHLGSRSNRERLALSVVRGVWLPNPPAVRHVTLDPLCEKKPIATRYLPPAMVRDVKPKMVSRTFTAGRKLLGTSLNGTALLAEVCKTKEPGPLSLGSS